MIPFTGSVGVNLESEKNNPLEKGYFLENNQSIQFQGIVMGGDRLIFFLGQLSKGKAEIGGMSKLPTSEKHGTDRPCMLDLPPTRSKV